MKPFFSIGVTTYDRVDMLVETLSSILAQTFEDFEVIVGNDNPDRILSGEFLDVNDPRIRFVNHQDNLGEVGNMNFMLNMSRGKFFTWIADDDLYAPNFLEAIYTSLLRFDFPFCVFTSFMSGGTFDNWMESIPGEGQVFEGSRFIKLYLSRKLKVIGCYGVFEREYIRQAGGVEQLGEGFSPYSDNLLVIKAGLFEKVVYIDAPLVFFRTHDKSMSCVSTDVDAFSSAQICLLDKSVEIFSGDGLIQDFRYNLYMLLKWCINNFVSVMFFRCDRAQWRKSASYFVSIRRYTKLLGGYQKIMPIVDLRIAISSVIKMVYARLNKRLARVR